MILAIESLNWTNGQIPAPAWFRHAFGTVCEVWLQRAGSGARRTDHRLLRKTPGRKRSSCGSRAAISLNFVDVDEIELFAHAQQLRKRAYLQFVHHPAAMHLHGLLHNPEFVRDLLVQIPLNYQPEHRLLPRREPREQ